MFRRFLQGAAIAVTAAVILPFAAPVAHAQEAAAEVPLLKGDWSFDGIFGTIDKQSAQRGLQIYKEVCSNCHGLYEMSYRNIAALGYSDEQVKNFAAQYQVADTNDDGAVIQRPAKPSDKFVRPFPNEKAARAANNGAYPPDLALIEKSREGGADYVYSLLQPADRRQAEDVGHARALQRVDIGAIIDLGRRDAMAAAVARQEHHVDPGQAAGAQLVRRLAERAVDLAPFHIGQPVDLIEPAAPDNANPRPRHAVFLRLMRGLKSRPDISHQTGRGRLEKQPLPPVERCGCR